MPSFLLHNTHYIVLPDAFILLRLHFLFPSSLIIYHHNKHYAISILLSQWEQEQPLRLLWLIMQKIKSLGNF